MAIPALIAAALVGGVSAIADAVSRGESTRRRQEQLERAGAELEAAPSVAAEYERDARAGAARSARDARSRSEAIAAGAGVTGAGDIARLQRASQVTEADLLDEVMGTARQLRLDEQRARTQARAAIDAAKTGIDVEQAENVSRTIGDLASTAGMVAAGQGTPGSLQALLGSSNATLMDDLLRLSAEERDAALSGLPDELRVKLARSMAGYNAR